MRQVDELIIIIPVILNLKGNLEMNLSARLGTAANVGGLDKVDVQRSVIYGNLLLLQVQATVVSFVATCVSFVIGLAVPDPVQSTRPDARGFNSLPLLHGLYSRAPYIPVKGKDGTQKSGVREYVSLLFYGDLILSDTSRFLMVASTSMTAACLSSFFLGSLMCCIVLLCRRFGRDPGRLCPPRPIPPSDQIIFIPPSCRQYCSANCVLLGGSDHTKLRRFSVDSAHSRDQHAHSICLGRGRHPKRRRMPDIYAP